MEDEMARDGDLGTDTALCVEEDDMGCGSKDLYNGRVILTLSTGSACWSPGFEYSQCTEALALHGLQVPSEDLELPLRQALDTPEVRRYFFFNSTLFLTLLAPALYLVMWCSLFSTFHLLQAPFWQEYFAPFCLALSAAAVILTGAIVLLLHRHHGKISINAEVRLTRTNEMVSGHHLLVGISDRMNNCSSQLHLSFCYFDVRECLQRLTHLLDGKQGSNICLLARMKRKLGRLCVMVIQSSETSRPGHHRDEATDSEETPLLGATLDVDPKRPHPVPSCTLACCVAPTGTPQEVASQLVVLYSALYVKLLTTQALPRSDFSLHANEAGVPCLCQLIETTLGSVCCL